MVHSSGLEEKKLFHYSFCVRPSHSVSFSVISSSTLPRLIGLLCSLLHIFPIICHILELDIYIRLCLVEKMGRIRVIALASRQ